MQSRAFQPGVMPRLVDFKPLVGAMGIISKLTCGFRTFAELGAENGDE